MYESAEPQAKKSKIEEKFAEVPARCKHSLMAADEAAEFTVSIAEAALRLQVIDFWKTDAIRINIIQ